MKKMIMMILVVTFMISSISNAQLSKSWEYTFSGNFLYSGKNLSFINENEPLLLTGTNGGEVNIGLHKLTKDGTVDWYHAFNLGGRDYGFELTVSDNNSIHFVGLKVDSLGKRENYSMSVSKAGDLLAQTKLAISTYEALADNNNYWTSFRMGRSGNVVSTTIPNWETLCASFGARIALISYAVNYYNAGNSSYAWEVGAISENSPTQQTSVLGEVTADGSIPVLENNRDVSHCNCIFSDCLPIFTVYIQKFNSNGSLAWRTQLPLGSGIILGQSKDYIVIETSGQPWTSNKSNAESFLINVVSLATGNIVLSYQVPDGSIAYQPEIHNNIMIMKVKSASSNSLYMFDISTGTLINSAPLGFSPAGEFGSKMLDNDGNVYLLNGNSEIVSFDLNLNERWKATVDAGTNVIRGFDTFNNIYTLHKNGSNFILSKYTQGSSLTLNDTNGNTLSNTDFYLIKVADDAPLYTPDTLGVVKTDADGKIKIQPVQ